MNSILSISNLLVILLIFIFMFQWRTFLLGRKVLKDNYKMLAIQLVHENVPFVYKKEEENVDCPTSCFIHIKPFGLMKILLKQKMSNVYFSGMAPFPFGEDNMPNSHQSSAVIKPVIQYHLQKFLSFHITEIIYISFSALEQLPPDDRLTINFSLKYRDISDLSTILKILSEMEIKFVDEID